MFGDVIPGEVVFSEVALGLVEFDENCEDTFGEITFGEVVFSMLTLGKVSFGEVECTPPRFNSETCREITSLASSVGVGSLNAHLLSAKGKHLKLPSLLVVPGVLCRSERRVSTNG